MVQTILVTGASGFLGAHIVSEALNKGYRVRATARAPKVEQLKKAYEKYGDRFDAVAISNIESDQFPEALEGVDAVVHNASPLPDRTSPEEVVNGTVGGMMNLVKQVEKAGIKRIVDISSIATVAPNGGQSYTDQDWYPATRESVLKGTPMDAYRGAKTLAEQALWEFADAHPHLDVTTVNPSYLYGPFADEFLLPPPNSGISTNNAIQNLLSPNGFFTFSANYTDVRDAAKVAVRALESPPTSVVGRKRIVLSSPHGLDFRKVIELIKEKRPELKERLVSVDRVPVYAMDRAPIDFGRVEEVVGMKKEDFMPLEKTFLEAVDAVVGVEKAWEAQGYEVVVTKFTE